jgi:hypothetical protein
MSFAIIAVGTPDEVHKQIEAAEVQDGLGSAVKSFLAEQMIKFAPTAPYPDSHKIVNVVEANGHTDVHSLSMNVSIRQIWVPSVKDDA